MTRRPLTLFGRLLLLTLPVECVVLTLFGVWLVRGSERQERVAFDDRLRLQGQAVLDGAGLDAAGRLKWDADLCLRALGGDTEGCLLDGRGAVLWESPAGWLEASGLHGFSQESLEVVHTVALSGRETRVLHRGRRIERPEDTEYSTGPLVEAVLARPLAAMEGGTRTLRMKTVAVGLSLVGLTALLLWAAIRGGLSPIGRMTGRLADVPGPAGTERLSETGLPEELLPLAREINGLLDRLWSVVQVERRFAAEAAHELRTPLTLVKSTLQTALLTAKSPRDHERALQEALEDLQRLEQTAESLLVLARADSDSGKAGLVFERVALDGLLRGLSERFEASAKQRDLTVSLDLRPSVLRGDRQGLERLFANLVDNAVKYSASGGSITLRCAPSEDGAVASVEDTGPTIPKSERPHLFKQFFRGASGRVAESQGGGLGLAIALAMARLHDAELTYEPRAPQGNRFVVRFPTPP